MTEMIDESDTTIAEGYDRALHGEQPLPREPEESTKNKKGASAPKGQRPKGVGSYIKNHYIQEGFSKNTKVSDAYNPWRC